MKPKIEIDAPILIVELHEAEKVRSRTHRVLETSGALGGDEVARGNRGLRARQIESDYQMAATAPCPAERSINAPSTVKAAKANDRTDGDRPA